MRLLHNLDQQQVQMKGGHMMSRCTGKLAAKMAIILPGTARCQLLFSTSMSHLFAAAV